MEDMVSLRDKRDKILFNDYIGMPHPEIASLLNISPKTVIETLRKPVLNHRSLFYVAYMDTSPAVINEIINTVQDHKNHGSNSIPPEH